MKLPPHTAARDFDASARKTFHNLLKHLLQSEFPGTFGPAVTELFAQHIELLFDRCHAPRDRVRPGQIVWLAVAADDLPARNKRIQDTRLVPILLDLVTAQDIDALVDGQSWSVLRRTRIARLCHQAYEQGAVLSHPDLALLLSMALSVVGKEIQQHERQHEETLPRRGSVHDLGMTITHKAIICHKRLVEKKTTSQVARETFHSPEAVEHYVQSLRRVKMCHDKGMPLEDICQATGHSKALVQEYLNLIDLLELPPFNEPEAPHHTLNETPHSQAMSDAKCQ